MTHRWCGDSFGHSWAVVVVASVGVITAGRGYDYLTKEVATSKHDYYTGVGEAPGRWVGRAAALLGLPGEVDADDMAVLYGRFVVPSTARGRWEREQVLDRAVSTRLRADGSVLEPTAALDVTFSPSKSVSLLWALSSDQQVCDSVIEAHEDAVATALEYLEAQASHTRTGAGGVRRVESGGFVVAQFRHRTARSTAPGERVGDPQLHPHCAILNRARPLAVECEARFGEHPSQICHDWNTADHVADYEGDPARRPFTRDELQAFFDFADERVVAARAHGRKGGLAAWSDTAMFKVTYAWGANRDADGCTECAQDLLVLGDTAAHHKDCTD